MANLHPQIIDKPLHENAESAIEESVFEFADSIVIQSKTIATIDGSDEVQAIHVRKAREVVLSVTHRTSKVREVLIFVGSLALGVGVQGFLQELGAATPRTGWMAIYALAGVMGTALSVAAFIRR